MKKWICQVLALLLLMSLFTGCQNSANGNQPSKFNGQLAEGGPLTAYENTVELSMLFETDVGTAYLNGDSIEDNIITRFIKEGYGNEYTHRKSGTHT